MPTVDGWVRKERKMKEIMVGRDKNIRSFDVRSWTLKETIEGFAVNESFFHLLTLYSQFLHGQLLFIDQFTHLYVVLVACLLTKIFNYLIFQVLLALVGVTQASLSLGLAEVQIRGWLNVRTCIDLYYGQKALGFGGWVIWFFGDVGIVAFREVIFDLHRGISLQILDKSGLSDGGSLLLVVEWFLQGNLSV